MIKPFGRQGPAATLRQHCTQMTRRRCNVLQLLLPVLLRQRSSDETAQDVAQLIEKSQSQTLTEQFRSVITDPF